VESCRPTSEAAIYYLSSTTAMGLSRHDRQMEHGRLAEATGEHPRERSSTTPALHPISRTCRSGLSLASSPASTRDLVASCTLNNQLTAACQRKTPLCALCLGGIIQTRHYASTLALNESGGRLQSTPHFIESALPTYRRRRDVLLPAVAAR
jgi:hypothetical protein